MVVKVKGAVGNGGYSMACKARTFTAQEFIELEHGKYYTYNEGCRCSDCTAAMTQYRRDKRRGKVVPSKDKAFMTVEDRVDIILEILHG